MLEFLNHNSGAFTIIFSAIVTLSTVAYAILTAYLVAETKKMRQVQTEPKIEVIVKSREEWISFLHAYVRNIGLGPAYDITFRIAAETGGEGAQTLIEDFTTANFFQTGLKYLGPGQQAMSGYTRTTEKFDEKIASILIFTVCYRSATGQSYQEEFRIDFSEFRGQRQLGKPHLYAIAQSLEKVQQDIHNLATGFNRIKANVYNREDRELEEKQWEELKEEMNTSLPNTALEKDVCEHSKK